MKMRKQFLFCLLFGVIGFSYAQDPITTKEKEDLLAKTPFNAIYPTSILKSADQYFGSQMGLFTQGVIEEKNAHLIALGTSAATKCKYCIPYHLSEARRLGASDEEIKTAVLSARDVMRMSTLFYGNEFDLNAFKALLNEGN